MGGKTEIIGKTKRMKNLTCPYVEPPAVKATAGKMVVVIWPGATKSEAIKLVLKAFGTPKSLERKLHATKGIRKL